jgi:hypothetical protein
VSVSRAQSRPVGPSALHLYMASAPPPRLAYREFKEVFVGYPPESRNNATTK